MLKTITICLMLAGCATTQPSGCSGYEGGRLTGLKMGASIKTPTQAVIDEIAALEMKCAVLP